MKRMRVFLVYVVLLFVASKIEAQTEKYYAAFVYQFTSYINWPGNPSVFIIGIVGNSSVTPHFQTLAKEKKVGTSSILIKEWNSAEDIDQCNIIFVPESQKGNITAIIDKLKTKPVLIVTESPGLIKQGAGISFQKSEGKIQFELNKTGIKKMGLDVSSALERLAVKVY